MPINRIAGGAHVTMIFRDISTGVFVGSNILAFQKTNELDFTTAELNGLLGALGQWWTDDLRATVSSDVQYTRAIARGLDNDEAAYTEGNPLSAGTYSGTRMPANVSIAVQFRTAYTGRSARGRAYHVGLPVAAVSENSITSAYRTLLLQAWDELKTHLPSGVIHVIISNYANNAARPAALPYPVTAYGFADLVVDTRRSRLKGNL